MNLSGQNLEVTGPKGNLSYTLLPGIKAKVEQSVIEISKDERNPMAQKLWGLSRTLVSNMVVGVTEGFEKRLEVNGVGFRVAVNGTALTLNLGFSHPVVFQLPEGVGARVERNVIVISGYNKQQVGEVAATLRSLKKPEPYKGKGIKYETETIRRKAGKTAAKGAK